MAPSFYTHTVDLFGSPLLLLLVSLLPGVLGSLLKLRLDPEADDETLLESAQRAQPWSALVFWLCLIWILVAASPQTVNYLFLVPLVLGTYFAVWTGRRRLLKERWSFPSYLTFVLRFLAGFAGPPLVLMITPALVLESPDVPTAGVVAVAVLLVIFHSYHRILPWVLGCRAWHPEETLAPRFLEIEERSELPVVPAKALIPVGPGLVYNAFAVTHPQRPSVLFTSALADDFPDDQLAGIHAHEVSHLEQFRHPRVRWTLEVAVLLLTFGSGLVVPLSMSSSAEDAWWIYVLWIVLILVLLFVRGRWAHGLESKADQRAVELLGGDGESLAAGLEELHKRQRMPRRLSAEVESRMTHPSLARRLQAIRRLSGRASVLPDASGVFLSPDGSSALLFEPERLLRLADLPEDASLAEPALDALLLKASARSTRSDAYGVFTELRLTRDRKGQPQIYGSSADGESWSRPIREDDVQRAIEWLDAVDGQLAEAPKQPLAGTRTWRLLAVLSMLLSLASWDALPAVALCGAFLLVTGHRAAAAALGASLVGAVFVLVRDQVVGSILPGVLFWIVLAVFVTSALLIFASVISKRTQRSGPVWPAAVVGLVLGLAGLAFILDVSRSASGFDLFTMSDALARLPSAWIVLLAAAAAMVTHRSRNVRAAAALPAVAAVLLALLSLSLVRQALTPDPLYSASRSSPPTIDLAEVDRWSMPLEPSGAGTDVHITAVRVAPGGSWIARKVWSRTEDDPHETETSWILTPRNGSGESQIRLSDGDFEFLGPSASVHRAIGPDPEFVYLDLASGERSRLPVDPAFFDLAVDGDSWQLAGFEETSEKATGYVSLTGTSEAFHGGEVQRFAHDFPSGDSPDGLPSDWSLVQDHLVFIESRWWSDSPWTPVAHSLGLRTINGSTLRVSPPTDGRSAGGARSLAEPILTTRLELDCPTQNPSSPDLFCLARDRDMTRLVRIPLDSVDGGSGPEILATLPGEYWALALQSAGSWTLFETGWQHLLRQRSSGRMFRLPEPAAATHDGIWTLTATEDGEPLLARLGPAGDLILYELAAPVDP